LEAHNIFNAEAEERKETVSNLELWIPVIHSSEVIVTYLLANTAKFGKSAQ
jgi:hypothetical protein